MGAVNPFQNLKVTEIEEELFERRLYKNVPLNAVKSEKEKILKDSLMGIVRLPALCFRNDKSLTELNLDKYEISAIEPLHDIKGHIKNICEALETTLKGDELNLLKESLNTCYGRKSKVKGCDYRLSAIIVYNNLKDGCSTELKELLYTLQEISRLAYMKASMRSPKSILCLYNITFKHALSCIAVFGRSPKLKKLYGIYFHSIITHFPEMARIISPNSLHTENEERLFSALNDVSTSTSNRMKESIRDNGIIRLQAEQKFQEENCSRKQLNYSKISNYSSATG